MGKYIANQAIKELIKSKASFEDVRVLILGFTFKENIRDIRNTRVREIYNELIEFGVKSFIYDPYADKEDALSEYSIELIDDVNVGAPYDSVIIAVKHDIFNESLLDNISAICRAGAIIIDVKGILDKDNINAKGFRYWRL